MQGAAAKFTVEPFTAGDGYAWRYRRFTPDGAAAAQVVFLHGIQSHGGWYEHSCERLRQAGFAVSFLDRRGSGLNEQGRGEHCISPARGPGHGPNSSCTARSTRTVEPESSRGFRRRRWRSADGATRRRCW